MAGAAKTETILFVGIAACDGLSLNEILRDSTGQWHGAGTCREALSSRLADHRLWSEVLNLGGFDVLMTLLEAEEVLRVTGSAQRNWGRKQVEGRARTSYGCNTRRLSYEDSTAV